MSFSSATVVSQKLIHYDILARKAVESDTITEFMIANGDEIKKFYSSAMASSGEIAAAIHARAYLHTFLLECRVRSNDPNLRARLLKKMQKFDSRGPQVPEIIGSTTRLPDRTPTPPPVAGPGPRTVAHYAAVAAAEDGVADNVPPRERSGMERGEDVDMGEEVARRDRDTLMGDLDAEGEDDLSGMEGVERTVERVIEGRDEDEEEDEGTQGGDEGDGTASQDVSRSKKGKQRARSPDDDGTGFDNSSDSGSLSVERKVIVSKPRQRQPAERPARRGFGIRPSGEYFEPPCQRCVKARSACEKDRGGGSCVLCKKRKQACQYSSRPRRKKIQSKAEIESEEDLSDRPISSRPKPRVSLPSITVLTPPPSVPARARQERTGAPPVRKAATKATRAIRRFAERHEVPSPQEVKPARRGTQSRSEMTAQGTLHGVNEMLERLTSRVENVISVAVGNGLEERLAQCEENGERLFKMLGALCTVFGITQEELEFDPMPNRREVPQDPEAHEMGTNVYYPRYRETGVGTSDDIATSKMSASPLNPAPAPPHRSTVRCLVTPVQPPESVSSGLSPILEVPTPAESLSDDELETDGEGVPGSASQGPETSMEPPTPLPDRPASPPLATSLPVGTLCDYESAMEESPPPRSQDHVEVPAHQEHAEASDPASALPDRATSPPDPSMPPLTPLVNLIRPTPDNSQEAALPGVVPLQPTPPEPSVPPPLLPTRTLPAPETTSPDSTCTGLSGPVSTLPNLPVHIPDTHAAEPQCPERHTDTAGPESTAGDPSQALAPCKRKRAASRSTPLPDGLQVPGSSGALTRSRSASLAASSSGPQTRSASRSRSVSVSRGQKRKPEDSGDDRESNKRHRP